MPATTTLLGLVTPTQGTLSGTWGDTVNYGISDYVDIAVAGTLTLTNDGAVTLANTTGSSAGSNITSSLTGAGTVTAQFAIVKVTGTLTVAKVVTGPSYSKTYTVVNSATGGIVTFKASGQTGVSVAVGETAFVYFNGTDYVKIVGTATAGAAGGSTTQVQYNNAGVLAGITGATTNGTTLTLVAPILGTPASGTVTNLTGTASININGTVGATTATTGAFTSLTASTTLGVTGVATFSAGTAALPALTTTGDTNTGIFFPAADTIAFTEGGVESMRIDSSGNVGIGTSSPATKLNLYGSNVAGVGQLKIDCPASDFSQLTLFVNNVSQAFIRTNASALDIGTASSTPFTFHTNGNERMRISNGGDVGIGTSSPASRLHVTGTFGSQLRLQETSGTFFDITGGGRLDIKNNAGTTIVSIAQSGSPVGTQLNLDSSGNLGIGTTSPASALYVKRTSGNSGIYTDYNGTNVGRIEAASNGNLYIGLTTGSGDIAIGNTANTSVVNLTSAGNVGIGTSSPTQKLDVVLSSATAYSSGVTGNGLRLYNSSTTTGQFVGITFNGEPTSGNGGLATIMGTTTGSGNMDLTFSTRSSATLAERMRITDAGNVGIGTTSPAGNLQISGSGDRSLLVTGGTAGTVSVQLGDSGAAGQGGMSYDNSVDALFFKSNGSERARIDSSGNLIVGATSAGNAKVTSVAGIGFEARDGTQPFYQWFNSAGATDKKYWRNGVNTSGDLQWQTVNDAYNAATNRMVLDNAGNLGLGVTPNAWSGNYKALQSGNGSSFVGFSGNNQTFVVSNAYNDGAWKYIQTSGAGYYNIGGVANGQHSWFIAPSGTAGNAITFTQAMTLSAAGNLGLGTTSPTGASGLTFAINGGAAQTRIALKNSTTGDATGDGFQIVLDSGSADVGFEQRENAAIRFITNNVEALRITNGQNVGIGTSSPSNKLSVSSSAGGNVASFTDTTTADLQINLTSGVSLLTPSTGILAFGTSSTERARIDSSGRFMVGTTSALNSGGAKASIQFAGGQGLFIATEAQGNGQVMGFNYNISTNVGSISITSTATAYNTSSDQRLKENIADANSASTLIDALQVRKFDWKADGSHQRYGFVAQELATVAPEAVYQPEDTEQMMAVDYSKLVPMLVKEIQSLRKRLADAGI